MLYLYITLKKDTQMSNEELTIMLLDKIGWDYDKILNPGHYKSTQDLFAGELILSIFNTENTPDAAKSIGFAYKTFITISERFLQPQFGKLNGGGETWKYRFLTELELRHCSDCKNLLSFDKFDISRVGDSTGRHHYCKECRKELNAILYKKDSVQESHKKSQIKNKAKIRERNTRYKIERTQRVPKWVETKEIREFYRNCPKGYHVDHIIPLRGRLVSGLHVLENLQYLTAEENMRKGNRFIIE